MKTIKFISAVLFLSLVVSSCYRRHPYPVRGKGADVSEIRSTGGFSKIAVSIDADVEYTPDSTYYLEVIAQSNIQEVLTTNVRHNTLEIGFEGTVWDHHPIKVLVHSPELRGVEISGSGVVLATRSFTTQIFDAQISGSGKIDLNGITASSVTGNISGSGSVYFGSGTCVSETLCISGSGSFNGLDLQTKTCNAKISGSGDVHVNVSEVLDACISGSGDIHYKGRPVVNSNNSGSGRLIHVD